MALDAYSPCPAGCGKKIKFCCNDLLTEWQKLDRMLEGNQLQACLTQAERADKKTPGRACLMGLRATLMLRMKQYDQAAEVTQKYAELFPNFAQARALRALSLMTGEDNLQGVEEVQAALEVDGDFPPILVEAVDLVGRWLTVANYPMAGLAHLLLAETLDPEGHIAPPVLREMKRQAWLNPLTYNDVAWSPPPADSPWAAGYRAAVETMQMGRWRQGADALKTLTGEFPTAAAAWRSYGFCLGFLARNAEACSAFRALAALNVSAEDKLEAEAYVQLLDEESDDAVDVLSHTFEVNNEDRLIEILASARQALAMPRPTEAPGEGDEAPPNAVYFWLDRNKPAADEALTSANFPFMAAQLLVFGKRTNRPAQLEVVGPDLPELESTVAHLRRELAEVLNGDPKVEAVSASALETLVTAPTPAPLPGLPPERLEDFVADERDRRLNNLWLNRPQRRFGGQTPRDAASKSPGAVSAALLLFELGSLLERRPTLDLNPIRRSLGLPELGRLEIVEAEAAARLSAAHLHRVDFSKLSDDALSVVLTRAQNLDVLNLIRSACLEVLNRPHLCEGSAKPQLYTALSSVAHSTAERLSFIDQGRAATPADKRETHARWDLAELPIRLMQGDEARAMELVNQVQRKYADLGWPLAMLQRMFSELAQASGARGASFPAPRPSAPAAAPAPSAPTGLWTPDSPAPGANPSASGKSGLWMPGMD